MEYPSLDLLDLHDKTAQIIRMAHSDVAGLGPRLHRLWNRTAGGLAYPGLRKSPKRTRSHQAGGAVGPVGL